MIRMDCKIEMHSPAVERAVNRAKPKTLREAGRFVQRVARAGIKHRRDPDNASSPGSPPHSHNSAMSTGFKKTIMYGMEPGNQAVVVGPRRLMTGGLSELAKVHEFGGMRTVRRWKGGISSKDIRTGAVAPVTENYVTKKDSKVRSESKRDPKSSRDVVWIKLRTKAQVKHSQRLAKRMREAYSRPMSVFYPARPYMRPALTLSQSKLAGFWYNAVRP